LGIKNNEKRWMDALADNLDARRDRAVAYVCFLLGFLPLMTGACRFLRTRMKSRRAQAIEQRKALAIENPVILLETDNTEAMSQQESPRALLVDMEEDASPRLHYTTADASPASAEQTESNMEYEFETC
jgi:hypothetical protein